MRATVILIWVAFLAAVVTALLGSDTDAWVAILTFGGMLTLLLSLFIIVDN